jgi:hypothetical protein
MSKLRDGVVAGIVAGIVSGAPSTVYTLARGGSLLESTRAVGTLLGRPTVARGLAAHTALSLTWGVVLSAALPRRHRRSAGLLAGAAIAALDLGVVGRRLPAIRALPQVPQWADHLAFGAATAAVLRERDRWHPEASGAR